MNNLGIKKIFFKESQDNRGSLTSIESNLCIPFDIKRIFYMHKVPANEERGGHAHKDTDQILIALNGSISILCSDGTNDISFTLNNASEGAYIPRMIWTNLNNFSNGAICLVLANTKYDMEKSIRTWKEYIAYRNTIERKEPEFLESTYTNLEENSE